MTRTSRELLAATLGLVFAACGKAKPPVQPTITFVEPTDGTALTADAGVATSGQLSITVVATAAGFATNASAELFVDGTGVQSKSVNLGVTTLTYTGVVLTGSPSPGTQHKLKIQATGTGPLVNSDTITVTVVLPSQGACTITIVPADNSLFNESGIQVAGHPTIQDKNTTLSGMQADVTVTVGTPCTDGIVRLTFGDGGGAQPPPVTSQNGVAVFSGITLPETTAAALSDASKLLAVTATAGADAGLSQGFAHYIVDSAIPSCTITSPVDGATITLADDVDASTSGIQINVSGTCQGFLGDIVGYTIIDPITNVPYGTDFLHADGSFSLKVTLVGTSDAFAIVISSLTGNPATSNTVTVGVDSSCPVPTLAFTLPAANQTFNLSVDEVAAPGFQTQLKFSTTAPNSDTVQVCSTVAPSAGAAACPFNASLFLVSGQTSQSATVNNGSATLDAATLGDDGAAANQTLTAQVSDTCGSAQATLTVQVHAIQPVISSVIVQNAFGNSDAGCVWLNSTNLVGGTAQTTVRVSVDGSDEFADGGGPTLAITGTSGQNDTAPLTGSGTLTADVPVSLGDGTYTATATVTDAFGNTSAPTAVAICVKTTLPTCTITAPDPATGCFNIADNGGVAGNGAMNVPILVGATNASALDINGLVIDGTATVKTGGGAGTSDDIASSVLVSVNSNQGANDYSATVTDPAGNPAAVCTPAALNVNVSTVAPTLAVTPVSAGNGQDAQGCEIYLTRDNISFTLVTTDLSDGTTVGLQATGPNGASSPKTTGTIAANAATISLSGVPNGIDTIAATGTDVCGNPGTGPACIDVQAPGCDLTIVSPVPTQSSTGESVVFNASQVDISGNAAIQLHTGCAAGTQVSFDSTPSGGSDIPLTGTSDANGNVTFNLTGLVDGSTGTFTASIAGGEALPTISYDAKLSLPAITTVTPVAGTLEIVANQDNLTLNGATSLSVPGGTIVANEAQCATTSCADFTIAGISGLGPVDGSGNIGTATLALNFPGFTTTNPSPVTLANGATSATFTGVGMPAVATGTVTLTLSDNVGNTATETWTVNADGIAPPAPTLTAAMSDKRAANVLLSWTVQPLGGDSAVTGYELAYVVNNLSVTPPAIPSAVTYATWTIDPATATMTGVVGAPLTYTKTGLPTLNQYTFELRAIDAVGNRSPLVADATAVSVSAADANAWQTVTLTDTDANAADSDFGYVLRNGDFNGDGKQDLVITAPFQYAGAPTPGIVYILNGATDLSTATFAGLSTLTLGGTAFDWFGQDAHVADYNGDGIDDLAVGSPEYNNGQGRVDIFFGANPAGLPAAPSTTIVGDGTAVGMFGYSVSAVDVNGDGIADLLVGAPLMGASENGASYLFLGSKNGWPAPAAGADVTTATSVVTGNPGDGLGARFGSVAIGDIDADGDGDFILGAPGGGGSDGVDGGSGSVYGFSGAMALANATMTVNTNAMFTLVGRPNGYCDPINYGYASGGGDPAFTLWTCFGVNAIGNVSFTGGALPDLIVSSDYYSTAYLYAMTSSGPTIPPTSSVADPSGAFGWSMVAPDLNGDGFPDLLVGENGGNPNISLYLNTGTGLPGAQSGELFGANGSAFGYGLAAGDLQGIAKPDFAVSDWETPDVVVYY